MKKSVKNKKILSSKRNQFKKGISPVIATVLLIGMVIVIGLIVFLWFRGIIQEDAIKFGKNIKLNCMDVEFEASYSKGILNIINKGNVPVYRMKIKKFQGGNYDTQELSTGWPERGLTHGESFSGAVSTTNIDRILLIPILIGSLEEGQKTYICEDQYGYEINI